MYEYADFLNGRMIFVLMDSEKTLDDRYSLLKLENDNFTISTIKKEEKGNGIVVRLFNGMMEKFTEGNILINKDVIRHI